MAEVVNTVDLVLYAGFTHAGDVKRRRLLSVGCVAGLEDGRPLIQELVCYGVDGKWHRVGSMAAMPLRAREKLNRVGGDVTLMDALDD